MAENLPNIPIAFSPQISEAPRVRTVQFGDGYAARVLDGLNTQPVKVTVPWKNRSHQEMRTLIDFFRRHGGHKWFFWHIDADDHPRKFICSKWSWSRASDTPSTNPRFDIDCELQEVFDLV